ncbi:MAG: glucose/arabinose dehydrogenase [Paraglaciecola sp.]|jgi:glucose/arabinose dehydrogenase
MMGCQIADLVVNKFAAGLDHPRWLYRLPNGDILMAQSNKNDESGGFVSWVQGKVMAAAGAEARVKSADRISLLRDTNHNGVADIQKYFCKICILLLVWRWSPIQMPS